MNFIDELLLRYTKFREKINANAKEAILREEGKKRKYYLDNYGAYHNADKLTHEEMLNVFWRIIKMGGYAVSNFNSDTSLEEPGKQCGDWYELGAGGFLTEIDRMFDFSRYDITSDEYERSKTFGELADFIIKKAKEKKRRQKEE